VKEKSMPQFRKKPVVIEARQFTGGWAEDIIAWVNENRSAGQKAYVGRDTGVHLVIPTLEGPHRADVGDWIIKGVAGEFYPCKPEIFEATYEAVTDEPQWRD
jgi:hypothetical protein